MKPVKKQYSHNQKDVSKAVELIKNGAKLKRTCMELGIPPSTVRSQMEGCKLRRVFIFLLLNSLILESHLSGAIG